jgi:hypothetical protein
LWGRKTAITPNRTQRVEWKIITCCKLNSSDQISRKTISQLMPMLHSFTAHQFSFSFMTLQDHGEIRVKRCVQLRRSFCQSSREMVCCLLCFSGAPIDGDEKSQREGKFQISLMDAVCKGQPCCILSCFCPCCAACKARQAVLDDDMTKYICCQGYISGCCCCKPGHVGMNTLFPPRGYFFF